MVNKWVTVVDMVKTITMVHVNLPSACFASALNKPECDIRKNFDTNEYLNIFALKNLHERIFEYIRITNLTRTNVQINICIENCTNIRIYSNIRLVFTL